MLADVDIPTLLVTHDYADALAFRERIVMLVDGAVVQDGTHADMLAHPRSRFVADFTGVNFFEGVLHDHDPDRLGRISLAGGVEIFAPAEDVAPGPVTVSLHPWEITIAPEQAAGSARNALAGTVVDILPLGGRVRVVLRTGADRELSLVAEITPESQAALACHEGQVLIATFKATALRVSPR
jgi:molybdopterin-binding protein